MTDSSVSDDSTLAYLNLEPEQILATLEDLGFHGDGRFLTLNSYENRVYQVGIEDGPPVVAKFYRPGRWTDEAILEEHAFSAELPPWTSLSSLHSPAMATPCIDPGRSVYPSHHARADAHRTSTTAT